MLEERLARKIMPTPDGCWLFTGCILRNGYGYVWNHQGPALAHRVYYEAIVGPIPKGKQLDHLCRQRSCVNPIHLEPVTNYENTLRGNHTIALAKRTGLCKRGHDRTGNGSDRWGHCNKCQADAQRRRFGRPIPDEVPI